MSAATLWWIAAGLGVALELASGTFYLLMLSLGLVAAGFVAQAGASTTSQLLTAAVLGGGAVAAWHVLRARETTPPVGQNKNVNLDIGEHVHVGHWQADGTARVQFSGSSWDARFQGHGTPHPGNYVIHAVEGNTLVLVPAPAARH